MGGGLNNSSGPKGGPATETHVGKHEQQPLKGSQEGVALGQEMGRQSTPETVGGTGVSAGSPT